MGNGFAVLWNDQSGNGIELGPSLNVNYTAPQWQASVLNSEPGFVAANAASVQLDADSNSVNFDNGGVTVFVVGSAGAEVFASNMYAAYLDLYLGSTTGNGPYADMNDTSNDAETNYSAMDVSGLVLVDSAWSYGSEDFRVNGTQITAISDGSYGGGPPGNIDGCDPQIYLYNPDTSGTSAILEVIVFPSVLDGTDRDAVRANIAAYYGITLP